MNTNQEIVPLSPKTLEEAISLAETCFPDDAGTPEGPTPALKASLDRHTFAEYYKKYSVDKLEYFVLTENNKIVGLTGIYAKINEKNQAWLGWFCIDPASRRKGYGKALLNWTLTEVKNRGYKTFRLYTSTDPNEAAAQTLYEQNGFKIVEQTGNDILRERVM